MREYVLVSDSTCDLPREMVKELGVEIIPFSYSINDEVINYYLDERDGDISEFYQRLRKGAMPATAQINPDTYFKAFEEYAKEGKDILYAGFTSGLSGALNSARIAKEMIEEEYPDINIEVVDTLSASVGQGILLIEAALEKKEGVSMEELKAWIENHGPKTAHLFMVEDLFHLKRGGRLSTAEAVIGSALKIKPILSVDKEGKLFVKSKTRGVNKALEYLITKVKESDIDLTTTRALIGHADALDKAERIKKLAIEAGMKEENLRIAPIGPIIGTHVGQGMAAIAFVKQ